MSVQTVDRIGVASLTKIYMAMGALYGLLVGIPMLLVGGLFGLGSGIVSLLIVLIMSVIVAAIGGAITALVYNFLAGAVGGIELHLSKGSASQSSGSVGAEHIEPET